MEQILFGQILRDFRLVSEQDLQRCLEIQRNQDKPKPLGEILVQEGLLDARAVASILAVQKKELDASKTCLGMSTRDLAQVLRSAKIEDYLAMARRLGASDLYLSANRVPLVRVHGTLVDLPVRPLSQQQARELIMSLLTPEQATRYHEKRSLDAGVTIPTAGRFRVNVFRHYGGIAAVIRVLPEKIKKLDELGLPAVARSFVEYSQGLVLITGPTGSGKTTTLAALIDCINQEQRLHVVALEDPIEYVFESKASFVTQRDVNLHTTSYSAALRSALREDPDVIVVGEMRDPETMATALTAAETGHLVFGTLHTRSAFSTVLRVIDQFPAQKRPHVRAVLASVLRAVICQELVPNLDGKGRSLATEVMIVNPAISNLIRENRIWQIPMIMQMGANTGMRLMDDSLLMLTRAKKIALEEAVSRSTDETKFLTPTGA